MSMDPKVKTHKEWKKISKSEECLKMKKSPKNKDDLNMKLNSKMKITSKRPKLAQK